MGLSCTCNQWDGDPGTWCYYVPDDFSQFDGKRRKRCSSCRCLIDKGADCLEFVRERAPYTEIEANITGEDQIQIASLFLCEKCGEPYLNLSALGYCISPTDDVHRLLEEYHELTGFGSQMPKGG